nr:hypothetical protein [Mycoplasmopsis bovis]
MLSKNPKYYSSDKTSSERIKIFFSSDPNINAALYDDKYIADYKNSGYPTISILNW